MTVKLELVRQTGPVRIRVSGAERVRVRISSVKDILRDAFKLIAAREKG